MRALNALWIASAIACAMLLSAGCSRGGALGAVCLAGQPRVYAAVGTRSGSFIDEFCGNSPTKVDEIRLPTDGAQVSLDHDKLGAVIELQTDQSDGTYGKLYRYDGRWRASSEIKNAPRGMLIDRNRSLVYVLQVRNNEDPAWRPEISVFDASTLREIRSFSAGSMSGNWILGMTGRNVVLERVGDAYFSVIDPDSGKVLRRVSTIACAMGSNKESFFALGCFGNVAAYSATNFSKRFDLKLGLVNVSGVRRRPLIALSDMEAFCLARSDGDELLVYSGRANKPQLTLKNVPIIGLAMDREGACYALVNDPIYGWADPRIDVIAHGRIDHSYTFSDKTYPYAMTVVQ